MLNICLVVKNIIICIVLLCYIIKCGVEKLEFYFKMLFIRFYLCFKGDDFFLMLRYFERMRRINWELNFFFVFKFCIKNVWGYVC